MSDATLRQVAVHEAGHAVIARVLGYDVARVTVEQSGAVLGHVATRGVEATGANRRAPHAVYCLAGLVAESRVRDDGFDLHDTLTGFFVDADGDLAMLSDLAAFTLQKVQVDDLTDAFEAVGRDMERLIVAAECTRAAVHAAWRRIDAVARRLESVRTIEDNGDPRALRPLLEGRGFRWYSRAFNAIGPMFEQK